MKSYDSVYPDNEAAGHNSHTTMQDTLCSHTQPTHWVGRKHHMAHSKEQCWPHPVSSTHTRKQYFHLQKPCNSKVQAKHPLVRQSLSNPLIPPTYSNSKGKRNNSFSGRPLPLPPVNGNSLRTKEHQLPEEGQTMQKKQLVRRKTVPNFTTSNPVYGELNPEPVEEHVYEVIDDDTGENDAEEYSFLSLISKERRRNLQFYGCTGWDFGTEM